MSPDGEHAPRSSASVSCSSKSPQPAPPAEPSPPSAGAPKEFADSWIALGNDEASAQAAWEDALRILDSVKDCEGWKLMFTLAARLKRSERFHELDPDRQDCESIFWPIIKRVWDIETDPHDEAYTEFCLQWHKSRGNILQEAMAKADDVWLQDSLYNRLAGDRRRCQRKTARLCLRLSMPHFRPFYLSSSSLAKYLQCTQQAAYACLQALERIGVITTVRRGNSKQKRANEYRWIWERPEEAIEPDPKPDWGNTV